MSASARGVRPDQAAAAANAVRRGPRVRVGSAEMRPLRFPRTLRPDLFDELDGVCSRAPSAARAAKTTGLHVSGARLAIVFIPKRHTQTRSTPQTRSTCPPPKRKNLGSVLNSGSESIDVADPPNVRRPLAPQWVGIA